MDRNVSLKTESVHGLESLNILNFILSSHFCSISAFFPQLLLLYQEKQNDCCFFLVIIEVVVYLISYKHGKCRVAFL